MAICACGMREHCSHLMHVFPRVILFVEDCQQGSSSHRRHPARPSPPAAVQPISRAAKPAQAARISITACLTCACMYVVKFKKWARLRSSPTLLRLQLCSSSTFAQTAKLSKRFTNLSLGSMSSILIWIPWSPSESKKLKFNDRSTQIHTISVITTQNSLVFLTSGL